ncbi:MAG TPA: PLP-dependent aminotransferase family protein [Polyangia bacterium]|nr:PLP-dependent aminotransferase family protein [Polyangia bacterium]
MRGWEVAVDLRADGDQPIFLRLARAISDDVRRGRLRPGDALPGSRTLARTLGVHRNTVLAAYGELAAEGWITTAEATGTFVSTALPEVEARRSPGIGARVAMPSRLGYDLPRRAPPPPQLPPLPTARVSKTARGKAANLASLPLQLSNGIPDVRLLPTAPLARAYRRALGHSPELLDYGDSRGLMRLRAALAAMLSALRGVAASADDVLITRGSQMALDLVARALLAPGDVVAVEGLGYRPAWTALASTGARVVPVPVDGEGIDVDALAALAAREALRAIYVTPHHQYPTTVGLAAGRRLQLLELARTRRIAVIEDDYDFEFHYEGRPVLPLAASDTSGSVVYIGTLSKILAPSLRLGFLVAPPPLVAEMREIRRYIDKHGDQVVEHAVAELIEDGELQRHARRMRRIYHARRDLMATTLQARLGDVLQLTVPAGGMALWARAADGIDVDAWAERCRERGADLRTGRYFAFDGRARPNLRLAFANLSEPEIEEAVRRLVLALA